MDDIAIRTEGLGKRFRLRHANAGAQYRTLREDLLGLPRRVLASLRAKREAREEFWALKDVSFEVKRGEVLGIIGRNGAGKSTLLKILSRIMDPTCGEAAVHGRIGSLLEVGTGFHPELTGRENIFLSGALLGMRREEVRRRFDEIVAFAGVEKFLDTPCKHYSSGMYARLGFAVAAHLDAEILLLDEVLAVGDAEFRERCRDKMQNIVCLSHRAVILISHDPALIRDLCSRVLLMEAGTIRMEGAASAVLHAYHYGSGWSGGSIVSEIERIHEGMTINRVKVGGIDSLNISVPADATCLDVEIAGDLKFEAPIALEVRLLDAEHLVIAFFSPSHLSGSVAIFPSGPFAISGRIRLPRLLKGDYYLCISLTDPNRCSWCDFKPTIRLSVEGTTTRIGVLSTGSHCGTMLLDEAL